jgi:F-box domain
MALLPSSFGHSRAVVDLNTRQESRTSYPVSANIDDKISRNSSALVTCSGRLSSLLLEPTRMYRRNDKSQSVYIPVSYTDTYSIYRSSYRGVPVSTGLRLRGGVTRAGEHEEGSVNRECFDGIMNPEKFAIVRSLTTIVDKRYHFKETKQTAIGPMNLPLEIIEFIACHLTFKDYATLRSVCKLTGQLNPIPTLTLPAYKQSTCYHIPRETKIKLKQDYINDEVLHYLVRMRHSKNFMRIFDQGNNRYFSLHAIKSVVDKLLEGFGTEAMLIKLLSPKYGIDPRGDEDLALRTCAKNGLNDAVKYLLYLGADVHASDDEAIEMASHEGRINTVHQLLKYGANPTRGLPFAAEFGHVDVLSLLLRAGADPSADQNLALRVACVS